MNASAWTSPKVAIFAEKNNKIALLMSCQRSHLPKTLKYSQSRDLDAATANFKPKRTVAASRGFLATARLSCRFYRATHVVLARYCYRKSSLRPSVCPSVTFRP